MLIYFGFNGSFSLPSFSYRCRVVVCQSFRFRSLMKLFSSLPTSHFLSHSLFVFCPMNKLSIALTLTASLSFSLADELPGYTCPDMTVANKPTFDAALDAYCGTSDNYLNSLYITQGSCSVYCASCTPNCCIQDEIGVDGVECADG